MLTDKVVLKYVVFAFTIAITSSKCFAQIKLNKFNSFIPEGYQLLDSASGNLDKDAYADLILILETNDKNLDGDANRPLILLAGTSNGNYKLISRNDNVVYCKSCGGIMGDPYQATVIKNGYFSIEHYGGSAWRWSRIITFKYNLAKKEFLLSRDAGVSYHVSNPNKMTSEIYNKDKYGKLKFTEYNNDDD